MKDKKFLPLLCALTIFFSSCVERQNFPPNSDGNDYVQSFEWWYQGEQFDLEIHVPQYIYDHYHSLPRNFRLPYQSYAVEDPQYPYLDSIVAALYHLAEPYHFSEREMDQFVMNFCQSIPYEKDSVHNSSPRFAVETLVEKRQICCDVSILCVTLLSVMGRHTCLLYIPDENHMAAGVAVSGGVSNFYRGRTGLRYLFMELTNSGWDLGTSSCPADSVVMCEISPAYPQSRYIKMTEVIPQTISSRQLNRP